MKDYPPINSKLQGIVYFTNEFGIPCMMSNGKNIIYRTPVINKLGYIFVYPKDTHYITKEKLDTE